MKKILVMANKGQHRQQYAFNLTRDNVTVISFSYIGRLGKSTQMSVYNGDKSTEVGTRYVDENWLTKLIQHIKAKRTDNWIVIIDYLENNSYTGYQQTAYFGVTDRFKELTPTDGIIIVFHKPYFDPEISFRSRWNNEHFLSRLQAEYDEIIEVTNGVGTKLYP